MTKKTLLVIILLITSFSFSQIDLGKGISSNGYIADDGTFFCFSLSGSTGAGRWNFINIDTDGNRKVEKIIKGFFPSFFDTKNKRWFYAYCKKGKVVIDQLDEQGEITQTEAINNNIKSSDRISFFINVKKEIEIHVHEYVKQGKVSKMPHLILEYNSDDKSYKFIDFKRIDDEMKKIKYIGTSDSKRYFINTTFNKKEKAFNHTLLISSKDKLKSVVLPKMNYVFTHPEISKSVSIIKPLNEEVGSLYFALHSEAESKAIITFFELVDDEKIMSIKVPLPENSLRDFPIYYTEEKDETVFTIKDVWNNRFLVTADFRNEDSDGGTFYVGEYNDMHEIGKKEGSIIFRICNGYARMVTISGNGKGTLYLRKASDED